MKKVNQIASALWHGRCGEWLRRWGARAAFGAVAAAASLGKAISMQTGEFGSALVMRKHTNTLLKRQRG